MPINLLADDDKPTNKPINLLADENHRAANDVVNSENLEKLPFFMRKLLEISPTVTRPLSKTVPERAQATGRGIQDIGEGLKQLYLEGKEKVGLGESGSANQYTRSREAERKQYAESEAGQDPYNKLIREAINTSPYLAPLRIAGAGKSLISKMLSSGGTFAGLKGLEFTPEKESRLENMITSGALGAAFPLALEVPSLANKAIQSLKPGNKQILSQAQELEKTLLGKQIELEPIAEKHAINESLEKEAKGSSVREIGKADENRIAFDIKNNEEKAKELETKIKDLSSQLEKNKNLPPLPEIGKSHLKNVEQSEKALKASEESVRSSENTYGEIEGNLNKTNENISNYLNSGATHDVQVAAKIKPILESLESKGKSAYSELMQKVENNNIQMAPNAIQQYEYDTGKILQKLKEGVNPREIPGVLEKENANPFLDRALSIAPTATDTNGKIFINKYKDLQEFMQQLREGIKKEGTASAREQMISALNQAKRIQTSAKEALEKGLGEDSKTFKELNKFYADVLHPLRQNKVARQIMETGTMPDNIIKSIRSPNKAPTLLRNIIKSDPEMIKGVLGQRLDASPNKFFNKNALRQEYIDQLPELKELIGQRSQYGSLKNEAKINIEKAKERAKQIKESHQETISISKEKEKEAKGIEKEKAARLAEKENIENKIAEHEKLYDKSQETISKYKEQMDKLKETASNKKQSLKEKMSIEKEISDLDKKIKTIKKEYEDSKGALLKYSTQVPVRIFKYVMRKLK